MRWTSATPNQRQRMTQKCKITDRRMILSAGTQVWVFNELSLDYFSTVVKIVACALF
jgi:hypothetical protein